MKITKKLYAEITSFLETYWKTYFDGDLKTWANFLPEDYRNIGTTKATCEGTGLGLSLSYDIVTKGHGGELEVTSKLGNGTTFVIKFPVK